LQEPPALFEFQDDGEEVPADGPHFNFDDAGPLAFDFDGGDDSSDEAAGGADGAPAEQEAKDSDYMLDFKSSVYIAGLLHVLHNTTKDLGTALLHWSLWVNQLKMVCRLLSNKWTKDRLLQTCFKDHPLDGDIKRFRARVYEARWGSIWYAVGQLMHIRDILCQSWAKQVFCYGDADMNERREETEHSVNLKVTDEALRSPLFWAYCVAMDTVGEIYERLALWGESCPCHWEADCLHGASRWQQRKALMQDMGLSNCPMRTLRAPECAAGEHFRILDRLMLLGHSMLLLHPCVSVLSAADRSVVLSDFARARQHTNMFLQVRLSFWRQLPWSLFAIGHHQRPVAIASAQRSLRLYANSPPEAEHHSLTAELLDPQSVAGAQMQLFAQGTRALEDLPCLLFWAAKMKFAAVTERWIESLHAQTKRMLATAPHASMLHVAWHGVQLPLRSRLLQKPELIK
jgi:mRNA-degrading endonuclease YafQ of YafQ-DinJ toxin-antitoxin module